jgi:hypothetical protein
LVSIHKSGGSQADGPTTADAQAGSEDELEAAGSAAEDSGDFRHLGSDEQVVSSVYPDSVFPVADDYSHFPDSAAPAVSADFPASVLLGSDDYYRLLDWACRLRLVAADGPVGHRVQAASAESEDSAEPPHSPPKKD